MILFLGFFFTLSSGAEAVLERAELTAGVGALRKQFESIKLNGNLYHSGAARGRKLFADHLLKTVEKQLASPVQLDPNASAILSNVSDLLDDILIMLLNEKDAHQAILNEIIDLQVHDYGHCSNFLHEGYDNVAWNASNISRANHEACRVIESAMRTNATAACDSLFNWLDSTDSALPSCAFPTQDRDHITEWDTFLTTGVNTFTHLRTTYYPLESPCVNYTDDTALYKTSCEVLQHQFENDFCAHRSVRLDWCADQVVCHSSMVANHNANVAVITPLNNQRLLDAEAITYVKCLITQLIAYTGESTSYTMATWTAACDYVHSEDFTNYSVVFPTIPAVPTCDSAAVDIYPGHADWVSTVYTPVLPNDITVKYPINCSAIP